MIARAPHLHDERLFACYVAERGGEAIDPRAAEHLADCGECGARYGELARFIDQLRAEAYAETAEIFTPERLRAQHQQIARRLAQVGRAARVISFPGPFVSRHMRASAARGVARWVYTAAAAGLVVGVALGAFYEAEWRTIRRTGPAPASLRATAAPRPVRPAPVATGGASAASDASDDAFLSELEVALERPRTRELQPFDALTPHVREIANMR